MSDAAPPGRIAVVGAGIVGTRVARELLTPLADGAAPDRSVPGHRMVVVTRRGERRELLARSFGHQAHVVLDAGAGARLDDDVAVVVLARAAGDQLDLARDQLEAGRHVVATTDDADEVAAMLELGGLAERRGRTLVVGAAMSPGLSCLLAAHAAATMDRVDEVHVARQGAAGPACARQRLRALRGTARELRDGEWVRRPGFSGRELVWFPDPVAGRDCYRAALAEPLLLQPALGSVTRVTARLAASRRDRALAPFPVLVPPPVEGGVGAVHVEVRGELAGERATVVYGALDRPGVAAGAVAAVAAVEAAAGRFPPGAMGLAGTARVLPMLGELARRGVRAATFEGAAAAGPTAESAQVRATAAEEPHAE